AGRDDGSTLLAASTAYRRVSLPRGRRAPSGPGSISGVLELAPIGGLGAVARAAPTSWRMDGSVADSVHTAHSPRVECACRCVAPRGHSRHHSNREHGSDGAQAAGQMMRLAAIIVLVTVVAVPRTAASQGKRWERQVRAQLDRTLNALQGTSRGGGQTRVLNVGP